MHILAADYEIYFNTNAKKSGKLKCRNKKNTNQKKESQYKI